MQPSRVPDDRQVMQSEYGVLEFYWLSLAQAGCTIPNISQLGLDGGQFSAFP